MRAAGLTLRQEYHRREGYRYDDGLNAMSRLAELPHPPTGVVVAHVDAAVGVLTQARACGLRVPEDLSVVAIHDSWTAQHTGPPLTVVEMHFSEMGRTAARQLVARIRTGTARDREIEDPAPRLIVRESTASPGR